ncbi:hypothetical protein [Anabaena subtropica]|uniref:Uncharacterized protein n=1 Tax=Anabaena subtropica FACHB-260 TaxID=2692884 RepID=A0ABR8CT48_9NOST|nr:hypothetical protein [Anabaena subtropica]MBD2345543.1 hypothetical protein [Anabaena subtropica FACHB-260]
MNNTNFNTIDPNQAHLPDEAVIQKVFSDEDKLPNEQHNKAVKAFFVSDGIASGIGKDLAFVDQIPNLVKEIIENKLWECLYIAKGVFTPYYCRYIKATDSENFRAFITSKRPNGLETSVETIDRVLQADPEVQRKFRGIISESRQGERTDLINETSAHEEPKLFDPSHQKRIRAANRAAEAIPEVAELLDRGLIAIDVAAQLGRDIKDPENLTAEEREYVDKRDLIGIRLRQYIYTNPIPEDEDREPAYSRDINNFVKDLLGIKDRSKSVRMDNPKKAAEKLLQFYQGDKLQELITHLRTGLNANTDSHEPIKKHSGQQNSQDFSELSRYDDSVPSSDIQDTNGTQAHKNQPASDEAQLTTQQAELDEWVRTGKLPTTFSKSPSGLDSETKTNIPLLKPAPIDNRTSEFADTYKVTKRETTELQTPDPNMELTADELAERLQVKPDTLRSIFNRNKEKFPRWAKKHDPDGIAWQRTDVKKGRCWLFVPINEAT